MSYPELKIEGKSYIVTCCNVVGRLEGTEVANEYTEERQGKDGKIREVIVRDLTHTVTCPNGIGHPDIEVHQRVEH